AAGHGEGGGMADNGRGDEVGGAGGRRTARRGGERDRRGRGIAAARVGDGHAGDDAADDGGGAGGRGAPRLLRGGEREGRRRGVAAAPVGGGHTADAAAAFDDQGDAGLRAGGQVGVVGAAQVHGDGHWRGLGGQAVDRRDQRLGQRVAGLLEGERAL